MPRGKYYCVATAANKYINTRTLAVIVLITEHRLKRVYAEIQPRDKSSICKGSDIVIGQIINDLIDVLTTPIGNVVLDDFGKLWLERSSFDKSNYPVMIPNSYLACSFESFQQVARLNCEVGKLATLPRSEQWRFVEAETAFREWIKLNDPQCLTDPCSFWSELWSDEY